MARKRKKLVKYRPPRAPMVAVHSQAATSKGACRRYAHEKCAVAGFKGSGYGECVRRETDFCLGGFGSGSRRLSGFSHCASLCDRGFYARRFNAE